MHERFTIYIDESGEAGIEKVRSDSERGASPYMTLGAALINNQHHKLVQETLEQIQTEMGKDFLHCSKLNHYPLINFARKITQRKMRLFGVISHKATLGTYKKTISDDSSMYYNKCAQYLLERVGWFMHSRGIPAENLDIVFEKANVDYDKMRSLLSACQVKPKHPTTKMLQNIRIKNISTKTKSEEPLLQVADLVAHALYKCVEKHPKHYGIPEPRYLQELGPHFFGHPETSAVVGAGLYCVHSMSDLKLDPDVTTVFESLIATPPSTN